MPQKRERLRQLRRSAGLTQEELAYRLGVDRTTVARWESGATEPSAWMQPKLAKLLGVPRFELPTLLAGSTPAAVRRVERVEPAEPVEREHLDLALADARRYLDSAVVSSFNRQLDAYMAADGQNGPTKTLPAVLGVITVVEDHARHVKVDVRRQLLRVGARSAEFAGWLYRDAYRSDLALYWRDRATEWAMEAGEWAMQGYILLKKSQSAWDDRDGVRMLTLAQAAQTGPWALPPLVKAEAAQQEARGLAMTGETRAAVEGKLEEAHELFAAADPNQQQPAQLGSHYTMNLLTMQSAIAYCEAGQPVRAAELYQECLSNQYFSYRDRGYFLSLQAGALALAGEPDRATDTAHQALTVAAQTNSRRTKQELLRVCHLLAPWKSRPVVHDLASALAT
jgi:transcriptional regulator with XRE-family HTH domain